MLSQPAREGDIVVVATPPDTHADLAVQALHSGRHVLCEKPLALTVAEARTMLEAARARNRRLGCCSARHQGTPVMEDVARVLA